MFINVLFYFFLFNIFLIIFNNNVIFYKFFYKVFFLILIMFFFISIFLNLNKYYKHNHYTSQVQRFWKRSFYVFWCLEFGLFFLFVYLTSIQFYESPYFLDLKNINLIDIESFNNIVFLYFFNLILIIGFYSIIFFYKNNNYININIYLYLILMLVFLFFFYEFYKFYLISTILSDSELLLTNKFNKNSYSVFLETEHQLKFRTSKFYFMLFTILKFWHLFFIMVYFAFFLKNFIDYKKISVDLWSSTFQNLIFLYIFNIISYWYLLKQFLLFFNNFYFYYYLNFNNHKWFSYLIFELFL